MDNMFRWFAVVLAPTLQPWVLIGAGAATVVEAKVSSWASFLALFFYCLLASSTYLAMEIYAVARPAQSQALLGRFRAWIDAHTDQAITLGACSSGCGSSPTASTLSSRRQHQPDHQQTACRPAATIAARCHRVHLGDIRVMRDHARHAAARSPLADRGAVHITSRTCCRPHHAVNRGGIERGHRIPDDHPHRR
jgi:hypothetical protein